MNSQVYERMRRQLEEEANDEASAAAKIPALFGQTDVCAECGEVEFTHNPETGRCPSIRSSTTFRKRTVAEEDAA